MESIINILVLAGLMALGYFCGSWAEKRHYRDIEAREQATARIQATNAKNIRLSKYEVEFAEMVSGNVVIGLDYFKMIMAMLRNIVGGRVRSYESLMDRARREALLRMKESRPDATIIINVRLETANIGGRSGQKGGMGCVEVYAYGTALKLKKAGLARKSS